MRVGETFGSYEVGELIGSGGFADVFLCYHQGLQTKVAVKVLHPHLSRDDAIRERFLQEAQIQWRADSDRVIQVTHVDQLTDGRPYLVMRYADLGTLHDLIRDRVATHGTLFSLKETVGIGLELVDCLGVLRDREIVHRDLKPVNLLLKSIRTPDHRRAEKFGLPANERLVLSDFGLAKRLQDGTNLASQIGGTPAYMAPELGSITAEVGWQADLFAIGVIIHELATGSVPWPDRTLASVADVDLDLVNVRGPRPDLPDNVDELLRRALAVDPADRHDSPEAFAEELADLVTASAPQRGPAPPAAVTVSDACRSALATASGDPRWAHRVPDARAHLDAPVRIGVVGGNRLSPIPLGLKLVGERPPPGEASLLGSVIVRLQHGENGALTAVLPGGDRRAGSWRKDDDGYLHLDLPVAAWSIQSLELSFARADLEGVEIIDVPHAALRRNRDQVSAVYESLDIVAVGLPGERSAGHAAVDEVLSLGQDGGPFAVVGVRQLGVSAESVHPVVLGTVPADDTIELRVLIDELLSGRRREMTRASASLLALQGGERELPPSAREVVERYPEAGELTALRRDLLASRLDAGTRRRLHRLLGRRMAAARLGVVADAPLPMLIDHAADEQRAWRRAEGAAIEPSQLVVGSLERLEGTLRARLDGATL